MPSHLSLSKLLYYCTKSNKKIKKIVNNSFCYIVPGVLGYDDIILSNYIKIPLLAGDIDQH